MQKFLTILASVFVVPIVFVVMVLISWNVVWPFSVALVDSLYENPTIDEFGAIFMQDFIWWLVLPFTASITAVKKVDRFVEEALENN